MSLLDELADSLCAASDHLPLPALRRAALDARRANERLVAAVRLGGSVHASLARLGSATAHLESGAGLIMRAQDEVGAYLSAIGSHSSPVDSAPLSTPHATYWAQRVAVLTTESGEACDDPARTPAELLSRVARAVSANDRADLHRQLVGAGAGLGSSLASASLRRLATQMLHRPPTPADVPAVRSRAPIGDLLPGLPARVPTTLIERACQIANAAHHDATDLAVGAAVLAARLAYAIGADVHA